MIKKKRNQSQGRSYGGQSQDERDHQRREQFLQAGLDIFGTVGFSQATVRGLCKQANLTDRYFYSEFGSTERLLIAVYEQHMTTIRNQVMTILARAEPDADAEQLIKLALRAFYQALSDPRVARVCMVELEGVSPETHQLYNTYIGSFADLILNFIRTLSPDWPYSDEEGTILSIAMIGAMRQLGTYWLLNPGTVQEDTLVRISTQLFMGVFNEVQVKNIKEP